MLATEAVSVSVSGDLSARTFFFLLAACLALAAGERLRSNQEAELTEEGAPSNDGSLPRQRALTAPRAV